MVSIIIKSEEKKKIVKWLLKYYAFSVVAIVLLKRDSFIEAGTGQHKEIFFKIIEKARAVRAKMWKTFYESLYKNWWCWKKYWITPIKNYDVIIK